MRIRLLSPTNIRVSPSDHSLPTIGVIYAGVELEVENRLYQGVEIEGINTYFRDDKGWYYWSGRAVILYKALPSPPKTEDEIAEEVGSWKFPLSESPAPPASDQTFTGPVSAQPPEPEPGILEPSHTPDPAAETKNPLSATTSPSAGRSAIRPNDPATPVLSPGLSADPPPAAVSRLSNWALEDLKVPEIFWTKEGLSGAGVRAILLNSGVDAGHPDLSEKNPGKINFCSAGAPASDTDGAGTACAGILAGVGRSTWQGVAPRAELIIGKVSDNMIGFDYKRLMTALEWVIEQKPDILVFCFDFRADSINSDQRQKIQSIIQRISASGTLCIAPVGDGSGTRPEDRWPAYLDSCLSVGAYNQSRQRSGSSLRSYTLDIMAPGEGLNPNDRVPPATVQAAVFTAGLLALCLELADRLKVRLDAAGWIKLIKDTAIPKYAITKCRDLEYGCGLINPEAILEALVRMKP